MVGDVVRAVIRPYAPVPYQVDGDYLGDTEHLEFRWEPDHLRLDRPGSLTAGGYPATLAPTRDFPRIWAHRSLAFAVVALYAVANAAVNTTRWALQRT